MSIRNLVIIAVLIIIVFLWYLFRPERLFISKTVNEKFPEVSSPEQTKSENSPQVLFSGDFHSGAHETKGMAKIYELPDGKRVLRLTDFETSNGPEVVVYLIAADDAIDSEAVKNSEHISLGPIKGNIGDQNYDIPSDVDLSKYRAVTIWCQRFAVNFGTAPLKAGSDNATASKKPLSIYEGNFHKGAHETKGMAKIYELPDGKRVLRFTNFETSNGPEVVVYLIAADDAKDSEAVKNSEHISLGPIKGNIGDQNYDIPSDVDLTKYRAVTIWCQRFGVNFGTAPLMASQNRRG